MNNLIQNRTSRIIILAIGGLVLLGIIMGLKYTNLGNATSDLDTGNNSSDNASATNTEPELETDLNSESELNDLDQSDNVEQQDLATVNSLSQVIPASATEDNQNQPSDWREWPVVPYMSETAKALYLAGLAEGNDIESFTVFGDCQSLGWLLFQPFVWQSYEADEEYEYLEPARLNYFDSLARVPVTSFDGATVASMLSVYWANQTLCEPGETPVECEFRLSNPSVVLIMLGTNWTGEPDEFEAYLRTLVEFALEEKVLPIIVTKPDGGPDFILNEVMVNVAAEYDVPLWNFWLAVQSLPNQGMDITDSKGIHFIDEAYVVKRYTGLQALNAAFEISIGK